MTENAYKPSYVERVLNNFFVNNNHCSFEIGDENKVIINEPWMRDDARLLGMMDDKEFVDTLNNIRLSSKFDAIYHIDHNKMEFIYGFVVPDDEENKDLINRNFCLNFEGKKFNCSFKEPTERLFVIAKSFERKSFDFIERSVRQIKPFADFAKPEQLSERHKAYFENRIPLCFFIECDTEVDFDCLELVSRHLNMIMSYYDRSTPVILINDGFVRPEKSLPIRYINDCFPTEFSVPQVDDFLLKLLEVGRFAAPRFAFVYYYQIFEYAGYYHMDWDTRSKLRRFLKDPTLVNCSEEKLAELVNLLPNLNHNDDVKMKKMIEAYCNPSEIWKEIENDKLFFSDRIEFEGGFTSKALISETTDMDSWNTMWMPKIYDYLTKIRNALVHARERRENQVILPTNLNNSKLERLTPILRRMAEQITLGATD